MNVLGNPLFLRRRAHKFFFLDKSDLDMLNSSLNKEELEKEIINLVRKKYKVKYILVAPSGKLALECALLALNTRKNDEVITQAYVCSEVPEIINKYSLVKYTDIDYSFNLSFNNLNKKTNKKTKAIIPVNLYGKKFDPKIIGLCKSKRISLISDNAHFIPELTGDISIFSFQKALSCPAGGLLLTNNSDIYNKAKSILDKLIIQYSSYLESYLIHSAVRSFALFSSFQRFFPLGFIKDRFRQIHKNKENSYRFSLQRNELALMLSQLKKIDFIIEHYKNQYNKFFSIMKKTPGIQIFPIEKDYIGIRFPILFHNEKNIKKVLEFLYIKGCFEPSLNYFLEYEKSLKLSPSFLKRSEEIKNRLIVVPLDNLSSSDFLQLKNLILKFI